MEEVHQLKDGILFGDPQMQVSKCDGQIIVTIFSDSSDYLFSKVVKMVYLQCKFCGYIWRYRGSSNYATCPMCHHKLNVQKHKIDFNEQEIDNWLIEQLKKAEEKLPEEYKAKIQWCIETLSNPAPAMQKMAARMFALSVIKNL